MSKNKQRLNRQRREFLLTFFDPTPKYQTREINGFVLVKQWNGMLNLWEVAIYTKDAFIKSQTWWQTSQQTDDNQLTLPSDGGSLRTLQDVGEKPDRLKKG